MTKLIQLTVILFGLIAGCRTSGNKTEMLRNNLEQIVAGKNAVVGVSIIGNNGKDTVTLNGNRRFPMQSVYKFHIALAVLSEVDKGKFSMDKEIVLGQEDLLPKDLYSPLRDENPYGGRFTVARLIQYAVSQSDNIACDVLIHLLGTPKTVEEYCKMNDIRDIAIKFNEKDMQSKWENMFQNWTTPLAASQTLQMFFDNENSKLSKDSYEFIWKTMKETTTGQNRIRGQLPENTVVAHKTGWSGTNKDTGITDAVNDIGIVFLPDGGHFFISVFITNSKENLETNEKLIADIAKTVYDFYSNVTE